MSNDGAEFIIGQRDSLLPELKNTRPWAKWLAEELTRGAEMHRWMLFRHVNKMPIQVEGRGSFTIPLYTNVKKDQ